MGKRLYIYLVSVCGPCLKIEKELQLYPYSTQIISSFIGGFREGGSPKAEKCVTKMVLFSRSLLNARFFNKSQIKMLKIKIQLRFFIYVQKIQILINF